MGYTRLADITDTSVTQSITSAMESRSEEYSVPPKTVAAEINVSARTVRRMCKRGELPAFKAGGQWRIRTDWREYLESQSGQN